VSMTLVTQLLQSWGYLAVFLFVGLESIGLPLPGETTLIAAALYAGSTHHLNIVAVAAVAAAAAIAGDNGGYWLGKHGGVRLVRRYGRFVGLDAGTLKVGRYLFDRHGSVVVFGGRFVTVLRTSAAFLAGLNGMRQSRFLIANAAGGLLWSAGWATGAYFLGSAAAHAGAVIAIVGLVVTALLTAGLTLAMKRSMRRLRQRAEESYPDSAVSGPHQRSPRALPASEGGQVQPVTYLTGEAVELRAAAVGRVLLGVEQADPQPCRPGVPDLRPGPLPPSRELVAGDELRALGDAGRLAGGAGGRPDSGGQADDSCLGLGDDAVPVVHGQRLLTRPADVLRFPVAVTDARRSGRRAQPLPDAAGRVIDPRGPGNAVEVAAQVVMVRP
jgi:membrane protein DedA with SNARE-associated domain